MDGEVMIEIPVSAAAAEALSNKAKARAIGALISDMVAPSPSKNDRLFTLSREIKAEARAKGLTDEMIDEELAAYNAERRS